MLLEGIFLPLTTPFHPDGRLYPRKLESNVEHYSRTPAAGMLVLSENGEAGSLTEIESRTVLEVAIRAAAEEKVMLASVGRESVYATLQLAHFAAASGYDAIMVKAPSFAADPAMQLETATHFRAIADAVSLPVILAGDLAVGLVAQLAQHPQIRAVVASPGSISAIKERTAGVSHEVRVTTVFAAATRRMLAASAQTGASLGGVAVLSASGLKTRSKKVGFQILSNSAMGMLEAWQKGASGSLPRLAACAPQACCEVWQAYRDGDQPLAEEKQDRILKAAARMEGPQGISAVKYGCDFNGYFGGRPRLPLLVAPSETCAAIEGELSGMRN